MEQLNKRMLAFFSTLWPAEEKRLVFGEGNGASPRLMLIGEAPGEQETLQGRPFVGKAGKNLDGFLDVVGLHRPDIWISNVVKVRPTKVSDKGRISNRPPSREELALFTPYLYEEIALVKPGVIVTLGNVALQAMLGAKAVIGDHHGQLAEASINGSAVRVFPLYHPASIIYNRSLAQVYQQDLSALRQLLDAHVI
ncbi:MAG: uracil-DNA glycosylase [Clostridia bacterium]|nr:uracil-DNA glycosylase [Clostridia bacterium]